MVPATVHHLSVRVQKNTTVISYLLALYIIIIPNFRFTLAIARSLPLFMVLAWIYTVSMVVKGIVYEKEERLKEVMKVMGLSNGIHWLAWFIASAIMMTISILLLLIILKVCNNIL